MNRLTRTILLCASLLGVAGPAMRLHAQPGAEQQLAELLPQVADPKQRGTVNAKIQAMRPFPAEALSGYLRHPQLALRLAALEILEEKAGGDFGFDPWLAPEAPESLDAFERWRHWAGLPPDEYGARNEEIDREKRLAYLADLLSGDFNKAARAAQMLEYDGMAAVGFLEQYLADNPGIAAVQRASIRSAQYQITLSSAFGTSAATMARHLAFGNRDQQLTALGQLKNSGLLALPVINEFLEHPDPLVRETAIDAMLSSGGHKAIPTVAPILAREVDPNVIHGALRRLKALKGDASLAIAVGFLKHDNEDLKISAIQACQLLLSGGDSMMMMSGFPMRGGSPGEKDKAEGARKEAHAGIIQALSDKRWRVRAAALECVAKCQITKAGPDCMRLLRDPDEFVAYHAINAIKSLRLDEASDELRRIILENPDHAGQALGCYASLGNPADKEITDKILSYPPDVRIAAAQAAQESGLLTLVVRLADDPDEDVACAALRALVYDEDNLKRRTALAVVVAALESGSTEKQNTIIEHISLPRNKGPLDPELSSAPQSLVGEVDSSEMDRLYASLLQAAGQADKQENPATRPDKTPNQLEEAIVKIARAGGKGSFRAGIALSNAGHKSGHALLLELYDKLSTGEKAKVARSLYDPRTSEALELLRRLIREPVDEVRSNAIRCCLSAEGTDAFAAMALEALREEQTGLRGHDFYSYQLESAARDSNAASRAIRDWAQKALKEEGRRDDERILALIILRNAQSRTDHKLMLGLAQSSPDKWVRRAAWYAYGKAGRGIKEHLDAIAGDPAPQVREVIPSLYSRIDMAWTHHFTDLHQTRDNSWSSRSSSPFLDSKARQVLEKFAREDPSPEVRFLAMVALLSHGKDVDAEALAKLLRDRPKEERASYRMANWMEQNLNRIGPGLAPVAAALDPSEIAPDELTRIVARTNPTAHEDDLTSFAVLAERAQQASTAPQQVQASGEGGEGAEVTRDSLLVIYFHKPGCKECEEVQRLLDVMKKDFPLVQLNKHNITQTEGTLLNQALCSRYRVPATDHNIAPALFTQGGFLVRDDINARAIGELFEATMKLAQSDNWARLDAPGRRQAEEVIEKRYRALTLPIVVIAGLIDGINPCAFATIIFFLSYLQIARRSRLEMIQVGVAFILAVFIAYFSAGLFLHKVLDQITGHVSGIKGYLDWIFAGLALLAAALSFRDALRARQGRLSEMTLTLPDSLKDRIRSVIRVSSKSRHYVITAFVAGIVISFLELACTGQVYAPIIYSIQQGKMDAVAWLAAYNVAFILPLVVIFVMAVTGLSNKRLIEFQQRHTFGVKIALGLLFVSLAAVILLGSKLLG